MQMFVNIPQPDLTTAPPLLECAYANCDHTFPHAEVKAWTFISGNERKYVGFCSWACSLNAFGKDYLAQA